MPHPPHARPCRPRRLHQHVSDRERADGILEPHTAGHVTIHDSPDHTDQVATFVRGLSVEELFDPTTWPQLLCLVEIVPNEDVLPVRAQYRDGEWSIGVNYFTDERPHWYNLGDVIASRLLTGRVPDIRRAVSFTGHGKAASLRPVRLRGEVAIDPRHDDFFTNVVEQRQVRRSTYGATDPVAAFLKVLANAGGYGIYAQLTPGDQPKDVSVRTGQTGTPPLMRRVRHPEGPGPYCYPPLAACITGAARLMLAVLEHEVTTAGGEWLFCDTDSMAIIATDTGGDLIECPGGSAAEPDGAGVVRALSYAEVDGIRESSTPSTPTTDNSYLTC